MDYKPIYSRARRHAPLLLTFSLGLFLSGCGNNMDTPETTAPGNTASNPVTTEDAVAKISPTEEHTATGTVRFIEESNGVRVIAGLAGLTPGEHGIHIHETGDCSAPDASSAGGHFNPTDQPHGKPGASEHHIGDLGNIVANAKGEATLDRVFSYLQLSGTNSIMERALVVHGEADDLSSQPSGDAGPRVGCGVISSAAL